MNTDGPGGLHSETQTKDDFGAKAQAATLGSPISEDRVEDTVSTVTQELELNHENNVLLAGLSVSEDKADKSVAIRELIARRMQQDLKQIRSNLEDDSPVGQGNCDVEELSEKFHCLAQDYWIVVKDWELKRLFKKPRKQGQVILW